jgi:predicted DNA-binding protein
MAFTVQIPTTLAEQIRQISKDTERTASGYVRLAVRERIERDLAPVVESSKP